MASNSFKQPDRAGLAVAGMPSQRSARVTPSEHDESIAANEPLGDNIVYEPLSRPISADDAGARQHAGVAPLRKGQLIAYALPAFSTTSLSLLISLYVNDFYVTLGAGLAFLSFFTALARSFDVITDPMMGWISDSTVSRFGMKGRRKPYMAWGAPLFGVMFILLFYPPPFYPNTPGEATDYDLRDPDSDFLYGHNVGGRDSAGGDNNVAASYWFGVFYVFFYLADTFTNVPYEALGPEMHPDPEAHAGSGWRLTAVRGVQQRSRLFFVQKLVNMFGMLCAAALPSGLAWLLRARDAATIDVPCGYLYHAASNASAVLHGTLDGQLLYVDAHPVEGGAIINKTAEFCVSGAGDFCYEARYDNGTHFWYEQSVKVIEDTCAGRPATTPLPVARYTLSSLAASQAAFVATAALFALYHVGAVQWLIRRVRERPPLATAAAPMPLVSSVMRSLNNAAFRPLLLAWALDGLALASLVTMFPFYIRYVVVPDGTAAEAKGQATDPQVLMAAFVFGLLIMAMLGSVLWLWVSRRVGKFFAWQAFNALNAATNLIFLFIGEGDTYLIIVAGLLNGIPVGGQFLVNTIMADVIDYDEFLNAARSEAAFSVFATLIPKFVAIPASAVPLALINLLGFVQPVDGVAQVQNDGVHRFIRAAFILVPFTCRFIRAAFILVPFTCAVGSFLVKFRYPIKTDRIAEAVQMGIEQYKAGAKLVFDPVCNKEVPQRRFNRADDEQAVLLEMFPQRTLQRYHAALSAATASEAAATLDDGGGDQKAAAAPRVRFTRQTRVPVIAYGCVTLTCLGVTAGTFPLLDRQKASVVPIVACIAFGFSMAALGAAALRHRSAHALERFQRQPPALPHGAAALGGGEPLDTCPSACAGLASPLEVHTRIVAQVLQLKQRGAAGGYNRTLRDTVVAGMLRTHQICRQRTLRVANSQGTDGGAHSQRALESVASQHSSLWSGDFAAVQEASTQVQPPTLPLALSDSRIGSGRGSDAAL